MAQAQKAGEREIRLEFLMLSGSESGGSGMDEDGYDSDESPDMDKLRESPKNLHALTQDTWSMGIIVIVKDLADMLAGEVRYSRVLRFLFAMLTLALNVAFQVMLLEYVYIYIVRKAVATTQSDYKLYHAQAFNSDGSFNQPGWNDLPVKESLCEAAMSDKFFTGMLLLLWTFRMIQEYREINRLRRHVTNLPTCKHVDDMVHEVEDGDGERHELICLTPMTKVTLWILIILPKFAIVTFLLFVGSRYLVSTESFADLILNAIALEFVINIDELLFAALYPESGPEEVDQLKIASVKKPMTKEQRSDSFVSGYHRSMVFMFIGIGWVLFYMLYFQQVIPGYAKDLHLHCPRYWDDSYTLTCQPFTEGCFPYGAGTGF